MMKLVTENFVAKLMSVLIALLLWVALIDEPELIETTTVPVEYRNLSSALDLSPDSPNRVQLQVRGSRARLNEVSPERTNIVLDLGSMKEPSAKTFTIQESSINLPKRVALVRAIPSQLRVRLERRLFKDVPVEVEYEHPLPPGMTVLTAEVSPSTIKVVGPESRVQAAEKIGTEPIDLKTADPSKPLRLNVQLTDPELSIVGSPIVTVRLSVQRQP